MNAINTPTYQRLREQIRTDIVDGVWKLGAHVTLGEMTRHYQVSMVPVREALLQLQGEGMIDMRMHRGAVIPAVNARYVDNLYQLRGAIQAALCREAARRATPADLDELTNRMATYEFAAMANDTSACVRANRELHYFIDSLADNPLALEVLKARSGLVDAFRRSHGYGSGRLDVVVAQHQAIAAAIQAADPEAAAAASLVHTESSRLDLLQLLQRDQDSSTH